MFRPCALGIILLLVLPAALSAQEAATSLDSWGERIGFALVGSFIVIGTLILLWLLCELIGIPFKRHAAAQQAAALASAKKASAPPAPVEQGSPPVAVIAAAVAACIDQPHQIQDIRRQDPGTGPSQPPANPS
ncbi:MAG: hypothetical protein EA402_14090 [Planctomycetota bacterium]|nr:MAG: hypothetical protein EA402_14090 [Planctomycetota bacterium]